MNTRFKKNQIVVEDCGCSYKILTIGKKCYTVRHVNDLDEWEWLIKDCEARCI